MTWKVTPQAVLDAHNAEHGPLPKPMAPMCHGYRVSGYWKGHCCGAVPKYILLDGSTWCRSHVPFNKGRIKLLNP